MPFSLMASVVSHRLGWNEVLVKQPSVVNSESPNASRLTHGGGGGGGDVPAGRGPVVSVRVSMVSCTGVALSRIRSRTSCGPSVAKTVVTMRVVPSSKSPSLSVSQA